MQSGEPTVDGITQNSLHYFAQKVWGQPHAISEIHSQGFEYINLKEYVGSIRDLFGRAVVRKILVRDEYRIAMEELQTDGYRNGAYVTGQPDIGKTLFLVYLLVQLLGQRRRVAVHSQDHSFYGIFTDTVAFYPITYTTPLRQWGPMYTLSDSNEIQAPPICFYRYDNLRLIQATSPERSRWHEWSKQAMAECYVMDIWTEQEIVNLANLLGYRSVQRMVDLWKRWGGAPRTLLRYFAKSDQQIENWYHDFVGQAVGNCKNTLQAIMGNRRPEGSDAPSRFYFCRPADYATSSIDRTRTCATVPTQTICNILGEALKGLSDAIKLDFFAALSQFSDTRQAAGFIYRAWFHCFISTANKSIDCHWLGDRDGDVTRLYGTTDLPSESTKELEVGKELPYYWPATAGYPGIDGALIRDDAIFAFQLTISPTYTSPEPGVRKLRDELPAHLKDLPWCVVFVGNMENLSEVVARQWVGKVFLMNTSQTAVPIVWSTVDPVAADVTYRIIRDGDESMEVVNE